MSILPSALIMIRRNPESETPVRFMSLYGVERCMEVPAIFTVSAADGGGLRALDVGYGSLSPVEGRSIAFEDAAVSIPRGETRRPAMVVDWDSLSSNEFKEGVVKRMRLRGLDTWFMTRIADTDDLMDAFNTTADTVFGPLEMISDEDALADIAYVSDGFVPVLDAGGIGGMERIMQSLARMEDLGFYRLCLMDREGLLDIDEWDDIRDSHPTTIPFVQGPDGIEGFEKTIVPFRVREDL